MRNECSPDFQSALGELVGKPAWAVDRYHGSMLLFYLGEKIPHQIRRKGDPPFTEVVERGQYCLDIACAAWRLENDGGIITSWSDDATSGVSIDTHIASITGARVREVTASRNYDLSLSFDNGLQLNVFCDQVLDPYDNYIYETPLEVFTSVREVCLVENVGRAHA